MDILGIFKYNTMKSISSIYIDGEVFVIKSPSKSWSFLTQLKGHEKKVLTLAFLLNMSSPKV